MRRALALAFVLSVLPISAIVAQSANDPQTLEFALGPAWRVADYNTTVANLGGTIQVGWLNPVNDREFFHLSYHYSVYSDAPGAFPAGLIVDRTQRVSRIAQRNTNSQQLSVAPSDPNQGDHSYEFSGEFRRYSTPGQAGPFGAVGLGIIGQHDASDRSLGISWSPVANVSAGYAWITTPTSRLFVETRPTYAVAGSDEPRWSVSFIAGVSRTFGGYGKE